MCVFVCMRACVRACACVRAWLFQREALARLVNATDEVQSGWVRREAQPAPHTHARTHAHTPHLIVLFLCPITDVPVNMQGLFAMPLFFAVLWLRAQCRITSP